MPRGTIGLFGDFFSMDFSTSFTIEEVLLVFDNKAKIIDVRKKQAPKKAVN